MQHPQLSGVPLDTRSKSFSLNALREILQMPKVSSDAFVEALPFSLRDATAGSETELQVAVIGRQDHVDLPVSIERSNYFANIVKRAAAGDTSQRAVTQLERYLAENHEGVWENSWVRFPLAKLSEFARRVVQADMLADKGNPQSSLRTDTEKFIFHEQGQEWLRLPVSYLIKVSLADVIGTQALLPRIVKETALRIMDCFLSDNTSPETVSFHVVPLVPESGGGTALARETSKRYLLTQLLIFYANNRLGLSEIGQRATVYFSPHPPTRQKELNECISDSFYREIFMSPCLSGWDNGQEKHRYMCLCHEVLSRSQLNAVAKLREAGIITRNLVVLPNVSNISLANNGTHISLGSRKLTHALESDASGFTHAHEKYVGDLVIKIVEHFLPLFVGTYSAAPYRLDFSDFHPERALGFLPHQLDYTHLRMIWRRWKKKAQLKIFGQPLTPFGLKSVDRAFSFLFRLRGDLIPDFRLVDYPISLMSTNRTAAFDGTLGNHDRLKKDLMDLGIFDARMSLYVLYRLREFAKMGFSGFEGRYYSLFHSLREDMAHATNLQHLITALAFKHILHGRLHHRDIPDDPVLESERRQIFFGSAIGIPTFYVHQNTPNLFLRELVRRTRGVRQSRRYPGFLRVINRQFRLALAEHLMTEASDLMEMLDMRDTMRNLIERIEQPQEHAAAARLIQGIVTDAAVPSPMNLNAREFNLAAQNHYRCGLKRQYLLEAFEFVEADYSPSCATVEALEEDVSHALRSILGPGSALEFLAAVREDVLNEKVSTENLRRFINLILLTIHADAKRSERERSNHGSNNVESSSIHRAGNQ